MYAFQIELAVKYNYLNDKFKAAYEWLRTRPLAELAPGAYPVCEGVTANVQHYTTMAPETARFETHDKFFDIQYVIEGKERFGVCRREGLKPAEVIAENDLVFYEEPEASSDVLLLPGDFIVVAPEDAHKPRCIACAACAVKKVVVKVAL